MSLFVKSCSRRNLAAFLAKELFDEDTRMKSNVRGRGKEQLDKEIIKYIKKKSFEFYPCTDSEVKEEWDKCIISIDESARSLKRQKKKKEASNKD